MLVSHFQADNEYQRHHHADEEQRRVENVHPTSSARFGDVIRRKD